MEDFDADVDDVIIRPPDRSLPAGITAFNTVDFIPFPTATQLPALFVQGTQMANAERGAPVVAHHLGHARAGDPVGGALPA
eukprot:2310892-Karenia_brevis.AAC.1